jgi:hypothetical protein
VWQQDIQLAVEQPESVLTLPDGATLDVDNDRAPDTVVRLNFNPSWGALSIAGMVRQIRYSDQSSNSAAWGGAISVGGKIRTFGFDNISFHASYGNALGRYTSFSAFNDGIVDAQGTSAATQYIFRICRLSTLVEFNVAIKHC